MLQYQDRWKSLDALGNFTNNTTYQVPRATRSLRLQIQDSKYNRAAFSARMIPAHKTLPPFILKER